MKAKLLTAILIIVAPFAFSQGLQPTISAMKWGADYNLHIKLGNDSAYVVDVRGLYHTGKNVFIDTTDNSTTYYPVTLDREFVDYIKSKKLDSPEEQKNDTAKTINLKTLWSALNESLGGGYIHFINCLVYSMESQSLNLNDPIFKRPVTKWKPKPITQSYKRTRKWEYYFPNTQQLAQKEYKLRKKENDLRDLQGVPARFIDLFLNTSQSNYEKLVKEKKNNMVAQIDLVRILLGAKYLGEDQIRHIRSRVISAVMRYNVNTLPSIIIFDDYNAAVALSLDMNGYKIDRIVYSDGEVVSGDELKGRTELIENLIKTINEANERVFRKKLQLYYQKKR
ncbi:MAG: hypothetical protein H6537_07335 [Bacteroidales bacterium]|nr:hypothetical protein [Bacteroidales bacterium]HPD95109.1 hypothetical protein [Tenuifilaceae bacterium]HRX31531.1 hypothetical protein [Tenuifilaceae bacterium]